MYIGWVSVKCRTVIWLSPVISEIMHEFRNDLNYLHNSCHCRNITEKLLNTAGPLKGGSTPSKGPMWGLVPVHLGRCVLSAALGGKALMENGSKGKNKTRYKVTGGYILPVYQTERREGSAFTRKPWLWWVALDRMCWEGRNGRWDGPGERSITGNDFQYFQGRLTSCQTHCLICCLGANLFLMSCGSGCFSWEHNCLMCAFSTSGNEKKHAFILIGEFLKCKWWCEIGWQQREGMMTQPADMQQYSALCWVVSPNVLTPLLPSARSYITESWHTC